MLILLQNIYHMGPEWVRRWVSNYEKEGLDGLFDQSS